MTNLMLMPSASNRFTARIAWLVRMYLKRSG